MHPQQLIDTVVQFEKDLAAFYERLEGIERFKRMRDVFDYMNKHSAIHAELIRNFRSDAGLPELNIEPLKALHAKIKTALAQQLEQTRDELEVYEKLAQAEALASQIYTAISNHFLRTADIYAKLGQNFKNLADDEMQHHDHVKKRIKGLTKNAETRNNDTGA